MGFIAIFVDTLFFLLPSYAKTIAGPGFRRSILIFAKKCPLFERSREQKFFLSYFVKTYQIFNLDFEEFLFGSY
jgi:hypothetical protein